MPSSKPQVMQKAIYMGVDMAADGSDKTMIYEYDGETITVLNYNLIEPELITKHIKPYKPNYPKGRK